MVEFLVTRNIKHPQRIKGDAGIDIFIPEFSEDFLKDFKEKNPFIKVEENKIILNPGEDVLIPSGLYTLFDSNLMLKVENKSGVCTKQKVICGSCIIDSSYRGEIHIHLFNISNQKTHLLFGQKIIQLVPIKIDDEEHITKVTSIDNFYKNVEKSHRGKNGFGSTNI